MIDGNQTSIIQDATNFTYQIPETQWWNTDLSINGHHLDILVENLGRPNWGVLEQIGQKGITSGMIKINGIVCTNLTIYSLDFNQSWIDQFDEDETMKPKISPPESIEKLQILKDSKSGKLLQTILQPRLYNAHLTIDDIKDTYLLLPDWTKGSVFVNGFNIGRYWNVGPQRTLYIPGPLFHKGRNRIQVFELHQPGKVLQFVDTPQLG